MKAIPLSVQKVSLQGVAGREAFRYVSFFALDGLPPDAPLTQLIFIGPLSGAAFVPDDSPSISGTLYLTSDGHNWRPAEFGR